MMTIVQAVPLIHRAHCRAYLLMTGQSLLFTPITQNLLLIHHLPTGAVQCIAYQDLKMLTEAGIEQAMKQFTPPQVDGPEVSTSPAPTRRASKRAAKEKDAVA